MKLTKSLAELDAAADELLAKSKAAEDKQAESEEEEVKPEEVSDDSATPESEDAENAETETKEKKSEDDLEKCKDTVKKSEKASSEEDDNKTQKSKDKDKDKDNENDKESDESDESDESEESEESEESDEEQTAEEAEKSVRDDFEADEEVKKGMDNSEFLSSVVDIFAKSLGDMQYDVQSQGRQQSAASEVLAKSLQAVMATNKSLRSENERLTRRINKLEKSMSSGFEKVLDAIDTMSAQPAHMRKSMASISIQDRDFDRSLNGHQTIGGFESLSKSQVLTILNNELYSGNQNVTPTDIISYESGAPLRQDLQNLVVQKCK